MNSDSTKFSDQLHEIANVKISTHLFLWVIGGFCFLVFVWAGVSKLDIVSQAQGDVLPSSQVKSVQHLEGGIVQSIQVKEGDRVKRGEPLVILESTSSGADVEQMRSHLAALKIDTLRLQAELNKVAEIPFPDEFRIEHFDLIQEAEKLFKVRKERHMSEEETQKEQVIQKEQEVKEIEARIKNMAEELQLLEEQVTISEGMVEDELTTRYNHITLLRDVSTLRSRVEEDAAALVRSQAALKAAQSASESLNHNYREEITEKLEESHRELTELENRLLKLEDNLERTVLTSPVNGVVREMHVFTRGGVVKPGETVLDIMPSGDRLIVDAKLPVQDIGYVQLGQDASVRLATADAMRFDKLDGEVVYISPDTLTDDDENPYYKVRIETERDYFQRGGLKYKLFPGMGVQVNIHTGKRTVLAYLLDPFFGYFDTSLKER